MADQEEEDLRMALRMSMQSSAPEPKRSKPLEVAPAPAESPEAKNRRLQRELMAAAAEKRMMGTKTATAAAASPLGLKTAPVSSGVNVGSEKARDLVNCIKKDVNLGNELSEADANELFYMIFGNEVTEGVLAQWSNQGIRFSSDPETSMGLVQHEGGPCGVLAAIQAFVFKCILFSPEDLGKVAPNMPVSSTSRRLCKSQHVTSHNFASLTEDGKSRALIRSIAEILFLCGSGTTATIATLGDLGVEGPGSCEGSSKDEIIGKALEDISIKSASDLQKNLRVTTYTSPASTFQRLEAMIPVFQSRMGAMLFLISALLSRGLENVQADRDDPSQPLVTAPFGHASQEIVNLLLCGQAVPNVFDGKMDLGGGMFLKGVSTNVDVGFLTLLESLNLCKVGQHLKCPRWPIWVVGSESHYTVLFALDVNVQEENELEERESHIRKAFDAQDQSGGGGFISVEGFHEVLRETNVSLPHEKLTQLCSTGFIVWSEFWQVILDLDKNLGGLKDSTGLMGKKIFDLYHFNGIAKSVINGTAVGGETPVQKPRLTKLRVSVPPRWTPEEFISGPALPPASGGSDGKDDVVEVSKPEPSQHAPLVDCIRTRWARATCFWEGDPPSIV